MVSGDTFQPRWASAPGETITEILRRRRMDISSFAADLGETEDYALCLLEGSCAINRTVAERLNELIGGSVSFWLNREAQYREDIARLEGIRDEEDASAWLKELPLRDMRTFGWVNRFDDKIRQAQECLRFFDASNIKEWRTNTVSVHNVVAFRTSETFQPQQGAVAAWLRQGEIVAANLECAKFNVERFRTSLQEVRKLTRVKDPTEFLPKLERLCAACGVAVVILRAPQGCRASGATKFISADKAMLLLSVRYRSDDHFWFTFFHEAGHLVLHDCAALFIEGKNLLSTHEEREADAFSEELLVPSEHQDEMRGLPNDFKKVMRFARKIGISPGIIVGQLQHAGIFAPEKMNYLKTRYSWD